jgi:hypothetical protein
MCINVYDCVVAEEKFLVHFWPSTPKSLASFDTLSDPR